MGGNPTAAGAAGMASSEVLQISQHTHTHTDNFQGSMQRVQCCKLLSLFQQGSAGNPGGLPLPFPRSGPMDFGPNKRRRF